ncbi:MAG: methylenetetrahydrofolate reductase [Spirochaetia bacterium]|jgi:methylenetetrahydrofolate reductase (NADPH)
MKSGSNLEKVLAAGHFAVTAELGPPAGSDVEFVHAKAELLRGVVDAVNVTDNQTAVVRMSSVAVSALLVQMGIEPVMQMVCRDRNRIAMQSDIFGAAALGIRNLTCLTGDHQEFGNQAGAKKVYDIDSVQLVAMVKRMRDERRILGSDEEIAGAVPLLIGAAANPFAKPYEFRALRLAKKVQAGADYVQTQCVFDVAMFVEWMKAVRDLGVHTKCRILAGVTPLKSAGMARYMSENVPGVVIPETIVKRMNDAPRGKGAETGLAICAEIIEQLRGIEGVAGIHIMAIEWEQKVREIVQTAKLLPRPALS